MVVTYLRPRDETETPKELGLKDERYIEILRYRKHSEKCRRYRPDEPDSHKQRSRNFSLTNTDVTNINQWERPSVDFSR